MADTATPPFTFDSNATRRLVIILFGIAIVVGAFLTPWWTRGLTLNHDCAYADPAAPTPPGCRINGNNNGNSNFGFSGTGLNGAEGVYLNYGIFHTPTDGLIGTDASRETAAGILGVGALLCVFFVAASQVIRFLAETGRIVCSPNLAVRLAIAGFATGLFTVLWGAFFLPLLGNGPGMLYGNNIPGGIPAPFDRIIQDSRYANAGFFLGIVGFVFVPAYLWADAHAARREAEWTVGTTTLATRGNPNLQ